MKQALLDKLSAVHLPENPLDQLVNHFGEVNVAELTGRTRRLIRDPGTGKVEYKKRAPDGVPMNRVNVHSMEQFQSGRCRVAIISDAGSLGISLHASNRAANRQRRVHVTLELGWSADKQMQCFGRTHRSDQAVPPEYVLLAKPPAVVHRDHITGAETVLYTLEVDRPSDKVSFDRADRLRSSQHGAFFRHQTRGDFILALQSGRHTDPNDGKTFSTYSIWKPGGSRTSYIREQDLNAKYVVVAPGEVRAWWVRQHARVPEIETREVHILAGAIIPLWQKLKTKEDVRNVSIIKLRDDAMKLRRNERRPTHSSFFCCGREQKKRSFVLPVQRVDDPHHPRGYRELRSPAEMRKLLARKILEQGMKCGICKRRFIDCSDMVPDHISPKGIGSSMER